MKGLNDNPMVATTQMKQPKISWHRGGAEVEAHATRAAFCHALRSSAEIVEIDVRTMGDGTLVCVHNPIVDGIGELRSVAYEQCDPLLREGIYTLDAFVADLEALDPQRSTVIHFDLKETGHELQAVDALVAANRPLFVTTLEISSVMLLRRERPEVVTLLTIGSVATSRTFVGRRWHRCCELLPFWRITRSAASGIAIHAGLATSLTRWWCRRRGLTVVVWTIDGRENLLRWLQSDVDVVTTNRPMKALSLRSSLSEQEPATTPSSRGARHRLRRLR